MGLETTEEDEYNHVGGRVFPPAVREGGVGRECHLFLENGLLKTQHSSSFFPEISKVKTSGSHEALVGGPPLSVEFVETAEPRAVPDYNIFPQVWSQ